jgi:hypothetical protein
MGPHAGALNRERELGGLSSLISQIPNLTFKIRSDNGGGRAVIAFSEYGQACARDIVREMEYDLQLVWTTIPSHFKAYAIIIPAGRKWLVSWCWKKSSDQMESHIVLRVSDALTHVTNETKRVL